MDEIPNLLFGCTRIRNMESRDTSNTSSCLDVHIWNLLVFFPHPTHDLPRCAGGGGTGHGVLGRGPGPCPGPGPAPAATGSGAKRPRPRAQRGARRRPRGREGAVAAGCGEGEEGCSPPATRRREGVLVAGRGEEKGGSVLTILTNTEVSKVGKFSYGPIPWK